MTDDFERSRKSISVIVREAISELRFLMKDEGLDNR